MKTNRLLTLLSLFAILVLSACTVQKRVHRGGYHIAFKKPYKSERSTLVQDPSTKASTGEVESTSKLEPSAIQSILETQSPHAAITNTLEEKNTSVVKKNSDFATASNEFSYEAYQPKVLEPELDDTLPKNNPNPYYPYKDQRKMNGFAIAGFVCSLVGLVFIPILFGIFGIVFSAVALGQIKKNKDTMKGRGLAIAGLVIGILIFLVFLAILYLLLVFF